MRKDNNIGESVLSDYEIGVLKGTPKTQGDLVIQDETTKAVLNRCLNKQMISRLDDGTEVMVSAKELIVAAAITDAINKGSFDKVLSMMKATGEIEPNTILVGAEKSKVDADLESRAIK